MGELEITAGDETSSLWDFVQSQIDDQLLDEIEVDWVMSDPEGFASEPIAIALVLTLAPPALIAITRLIERWLEMHRQNNQMELVYKGFNLSPEAGLAMTALAEAHARVSVKHDLLQS